MISPIRIAYFNVEGLSADKHRTCCALIDAGIVDILFLSETWFMNKCSYMSHPYSFLHSKPNPAAPKNTRGREGIFIMLSPRARKLVHQYRVLDKALWVQFSGGIRVVATYLPPSMSDDELKSSLDGFPDYDLLLGDINVRFKDITKKAPSKVSLQDLWHSYMNRRNLTLAKPSITPFTLHSSVLLPSTIRQLFADGQPLLTHPNCELDHVLQSPSAPTLELTLLDAKQFDLKSAHKYILVCSIQQQQPEEEATTRESLGRFHLEKLHKKKNQDRLLQAWSSLDAQIDWDVQDVDQYDSRLLHAVTTAAESSLGTYDVLTRKKAPDRVASKLINSRTTSTLASIRLFKRKRRVNNNNTLQSRSPDCTPMDECVHKLPRPFLHFRPSSLPTRPPPRRSLAPKIIGIDR